VEIHGTSKEVIMRFISWIGSGVLAGAFGVCAGMPLLAQTQPQIERVPAKSILSVEGNDSYVAYCAVCHGRDAKGAGPAAPALKATVPDLTTLARRSAGKFDAVAVRRLITGEDKVVNLSHGTSDMPIWGPVFRAMRSDEVAAIRVKNLVTYLESVQQK
jgi:mono/diheme cytochrome c family protein